MRVPLSLKRKQGASEGRSAEEPWGERSAAPQCARLRPLGSWLPALREPTEAACAHHSAHRSTQRRDRWPPCAASGRRWGPRERVGLDSRYSVLTRRRLVLSPEGRPGEFCPPSRLHSKRPRGRNTLTELTWASLKGRLPAAARSRRVLWREDKQLQGSASANPRGLRYTDKAGATVPRD